MDTISRLTYPENYKMDNLETPMGLYVPDTHKNGQAQKDPRHLFSQLIIDQDPQLYVQ